MDQPKILMLLFRLYMTFYHCSQGISADERQFNGALKVYSDTFFTGSVLKSLKAINDLQCAHKCLQNRWCIGMVYCLKDTRCFLFEDRELMVDTASKYFIQRQGCTFYQFAEPMDQCSNIHCQNGGTCRHDNTLGRFTCSCIEDFVGERCEQSKPVQYTFTNLNAIGRIGPTSIQAYSGTTLESKVSVTKGIQTWNVPKTGRYQVTITGASGGDGVFGIKGGLGARVQGHVTLKQGDDIIIVVGQAGAEMPSNAGGGGGGTFVYYSTSKIIGIAGGGGGGGGQITQKNGQGGLATLTGGVRGGKAGFGGIVCMVGNSKNSPGGGGGFAKDGSCYKPPSCGENQTCTEGGGSYNTGFVGGFGDSVGGFGGGGASVGIFPGGGGGFSGGGVEAKANQGQAGGGGSKTLDATWKAEPAINKGHGKVVFTLVGLT